MEKKLLGKIAQSQDCQHQLERQFVKLNDCLQREDRYDFVVTQLVSIAEHGHPMRETIFQRLFADFIPNAPRAVLEGLV